MERKAISDQEAEEINAALHGKMKELDNMVAQAGQMVRTDSPAHSLSDELGTHRLGGGDVSLRDHLQYLLLTAWAT